MAGPPPNSVTARTRADWRAWLAAHHARPAGVWLVTFKKGSGEPHLPYADAVEEALCFGWVDSKPAKLDAERSTLYFAPRQAKSGWSKPNKGRAERLTAAGLMHASGLAAVAAAKADGSWTKLDAVERLEVPADLAAALAALPPAAARFAAFPKSARRGILEWVEQGEAGGHPAEARRRDGPAGAGKRAGEPVAAGGLTPQLGRAAMRFLITGGYGFIGAWIAKRLLGDGAGVVLFDLRENPARLRLVMTEAEARECAFAPGDVTDPAALLAAIRDHAITHVIHLAGLQVPTCRANPVLGATVNVLGTLAVFEAVRTSGTVNRVVYASSAAVFGGPDRYPAGPQPDAGPLLPGTHYGVFKVCNEGNARIYFQDHNISSVGLRPWTVYGPGRDLGMTSDPTKAVKSVLLGRPFHVGFGRLDRLPVRPRRGRRVRPERDPPVHRRGRV